MARVSSKNTTPEMIVRRLIHRMGYRYKLHDRLLPGVPDLVFPRRRAVIFVHGCFWHQHPDPNCKRARQPKSRLEYWLPKLRGNRERDDQNVRALANDGWRVLQVWECQLRAIDELKASIKRFLDEGNR